MSKFFTVEEVYTSCEEKGLLIPQATVDINKIRSNIIISEEDLASAKDAILKKRWNSAYKLYYDVLHILVESFLCFDRIKSMKSSMFIFVSMFKAPRT